MLCMSGCSVYDGDRLQGTAGTDGTRPMDGGSMGGSGGGGAGGSGGGGGEEADGAVAPPASPDAAMPDAGFPDGCRSSDDEFCPEICPETCNGSDDDCDGAVDEGEARESCTVAHAQALCLEGQCLIGSCEDGYRDCDGDPLNGCEVPPGSVEHCGLCGMSCGVTHGVSACVEGDCALAECEQGFGDCDATLSNGCELRLDTTRHCGSCDQSCGSLENGTAGCAEGMCAVSSCDTGFGDCDGDSSNGCETPLDTVEHCGQCDTSCDFPTATAACTSGVCVPQTCDPGYGDCDGDPATGCEQELVTNAHCGACGVECDAAALAHVSEAQCSDTGTCEIVACEAGWGDCDGDVDTGCEKPLDTLLNCGACGEPCGFSNASASCATGSCELVSCDTGWGDCINGLEDGCETPLDTTSDCGACGNTCTTVDGEEQQCSGGVCTVAQCDVGSADCDGDASNGCETNIHPTGPAETLADCGACGKSCGPLDHATATCGDGTCRIGSCDAGWEDCDGDVSNGCETPLDTTNDCGSCGNSCSYARGIAACNGGTCELVGCQDGYSNCDGDASNGCETLLNTLSDCSACGDVCDLDHASEACSDGQCNLTACDAGWGDCDGQVGNGCETSLSTLSDCGACGSVCALDHASEVCDAGTCKLGSCDADWADCDGDPSNGCETSLTTLSDCGDCGVQCGFTNASASCSTGSCEFVECDSGWGNCDGDLSDGCEQSLDTLDHCGACNNTCALSHADESCMSGSCEITQCEDLWGDCDLDAGNGCEQDLTTLSHCGMCGQECSLAHATETCGSGLCAIESCDSGWKDCDGDPSNGCEEDAATGSCFTYVPSNFDPDDPDLDASYASSIVLDCGVARFDSASLAFENWCGQALPTPVVRTQSSGPDVVILPLPTFQVADGSALDIVGDRPVILAVYGGADIDGHIDGSASATTAGPGGEVACSEGSGADGTTGGWADYEGGGGGGGGFGSQGAAGGYGNGTDDPGGAGGSTEGNAQLVPLRGGCGGGRGGGASGHQGPGGGGGGAVQLSASGRIDVSGIVSCGGGGGRGAADDSGGGGGGGAGGAVLLEGDSVVLASGSWVTANGGGGGGGNDEYYSSAGDGALGRPSSSSAAAGGDGSGSGGDGGAGASADNATANGGQNGGGDDGGGGGGGGVGRIRVRGATSCTLSGGISPAPATACP